MGARYTKEVLADSPVGYWPLDDDDYDTVLDKSGNGRNGSVSGQVSLARAMTKGGKGMKFFGKTNAAVFIPDNNAFTANNFSIEAIIDLSATNVAGVVLRKEISNSTWPEWGLYFASSDGTIRVDFWTANNNSPGTRKELVGPDLRGVGERHVIGTYDGSSLKLYVEGSVVASMSATGNPWNGGGRPAIGCSDWITTAPVSFKGMVRDVAFYNTALSSTRIAAHVAALRRSVAGVTDAGDPPAHVKRKVFLVSRGGEFLGSTDSDVSTGAYSMATDEGGAIYGLAFPDVGDVWIPTTAYALAAKAITRTNNGHWYEVETAGTTGSTEPTWPTSGGTVTDGTVVWRDKGTITRPWAEGPYAAPAA